MLFLLVLVKVKGVIMFQRVSDLARGSPLDSCDVLFDIGIRVQ